MRRACDGVNTVVETAYYELWNTILVDKKIHTSLTVTYIPLGGGNLNHIGGCCCIVEVRKIMYALFYKQKKRSRNWLSYNERSITEEVYSANSSIETTFPNLYLSYG